MQPILITLLIVVNLVLWAVFFIKFKTLFSTNDIIAKTREQLDRLLSDIQHNTLSNIDLIEAKITELNQAIEIADKKLKFLHEDKEFQKAKKEVEQNLKTPAGSFSKRRIASPPADTSPANSKAVVDELVQDDEQSYRINISRQSKQKNSQPIQTRQTFVSIVKEFVNKGYSVEETAKKLGASITEVQMVYDMYL